MRNLAGMMGVIAAATFLIPPHTANATKSETATVPPVQIVQSAQWDMVSAKGLKYRIMISTPQQPAPPGGYPIIYVLDGNSNFGTVTEAVRMQGRKRERTGVSPSLVVAIGYPIDGPFDEHRRGFDYVVRASGKNSPMQVPGRPAVPDSGGGADDFLDFILNSLKPAVERQYPVDRHKQTLLGHSFGGFFTLYTMFKSPGSFQNYLALSPSIWWNQRSILEDQRRFLATRKPSDPPVNLFLATGSLESSKGIPMVADSRELVSRMTAAKALDVSSQFFLIEGEDHGSIVPTVISRALRARLGDGMKSPEDAAH